MAKPEMHVEIKLCPTDETMQVLIGLLNMWQDAHPNKEVSLVPDGACYGYKIVDREYKAYTEGE